MDLYSEHLAPATFLRHRHQNPSGILGCADQVISRRKVMHCTLLRSKPTSFRSSMAMAWSQKRYVRRNLFGPPSSRSIARPYDDFGTNGIPCRCFSYSDTNRQIFCTIVFSQTHARYLEPLHYRARNGCKTVTGSVLHCAYYIKKRGEKGERNTCVLLVEMNTRRNGKELMNCNYTNNLTPI